MRRQEVKLDGKRPAKSLEKKTKNRGFQGKLQGGVPNMALLSSGKESTEKLIL